MRWPAVVLAGLITLIFQVIPRIIWFRFLAVILENIRRLLSTNLYHTGSFIIFVPLGVLASTLDWRPELSAFLNALAVGSASFLAAVLAEEFVRFFPLGLGLVAEAFFSNSPWLVVRQPTPTVMKMAIDLQGRLASGRWREASSRSSRTSYPGVSCAGIPSLLAAASSPAAYLGDNKP